MDSVVKPEAMIKTSHADPLLIASILLLVSLGIVTLYSGSYASAERYFGNGMYFVIRQLIFGAVGIALFFVCIYIPLEVLRKFILPLVLITVVLCILTRVPGIGVSKNGAPRWIGYGSVTYQPSELAKVVLPIYLAHIFSKKEEKDGTFQAMNSFVKGILPPTLVVTLFFFIIYLQNNFSTAVFVAVNGLLIFFLAGVRIRYFIGALAILVPVSTLLVLTSNHRLLRILSFINPQLDPLGASFQVRGSVLSVSSGGIWGKGMGMGTRKLGSVPEIQSDFIFSAYTEELGFIGVLFFFALFAFFAWRGYRAALRSEDSFRRLLGFSLITVIVSQALVNVAVTCGALPATGIPLPFFSAGGSALVMNLMTVGLVVHISRTEASHGL
jgi:cell division protein FtsW